MQQIQADDSGDDQALDLLVAALGALLVVRIAAANRTVHALPTTSGIVGHSAPDFSLVAWTGQSGLAGQSGHTIHLAALKGHSVVLKLWVSWCEPCQADGTALLGHCGITYACGPDTTRRPLPRVE